MFEELKGATPEEIARRGVEGALPPEIMATPLSKRAEVLGDLWLVNLERQFGRPEKARDIWEKINTGYQDPGIKEYNRQVKAGIKP
jgi:hypothetical protein